MGLLKEEGTNNWVVLMVLELAGIMQGLWATFDLLYQVYVIIYFLVMLCTVPLCSTPRS